MTQGPPSNTGVTQVCSQGHWCYARVPAPSCGHCRHMQGLECVHSMARRCRMQRRCVSHVCRSIISAGTHNEDSGPGDRPPCSSARSVGCVVRVVLVDACCCCCWREELCLVVMRWFPYVRDRWRTTAAASSLEDRPGRQPYSCRVPTAPALALDHPSAPCLRPCTYLCPCPPLLLTRRLP